VNYILHTFRVTQTKSVSNFFHTVIDNIILKHSADSKKIQNMILVTVTIQFTPRVHCWLFRLIVTWSVIAWVQSNVCCPQSIWEGNRHPRKGLWYVLQKTDAHMHKHHERNGHRQLWDCHTVNELHWLTYACAGEDVGH